MASIKIKDFFNGKFFVIPKYQRGYAWEVAPNIRDLFEDIYESIESNSSHYIGTIVLSKAIDDDEKFYVVDGQQRITTITLIINALVKGLPEKDAAYYERFYIKEDKRYRLTPLSRDNKYFIDLVENIVGNPQNKSQRYLKDAVEEITFKVTQIEDKLKFLKAVEKLEIMEFVENSEGDAIRIFLTVNDRGKPLSNMEKAKSLLIYFSNRYLKKKLDDTINNYFSEIFELYDDIKHLGEDLGINLISARDFNEDNLMRYHFVSFSDSNYDPTPSYVLQFLKNQLTKCRTEAKGKDCTKMEEFITGYINSLKDFFINCKKVIERAKTEAKYYKMFVILNLSATLYPLIIKLETLGVLNTPLVGAKRTQFTFFDLVELIEVRIYKTRGTDPKAEISRFTYGIAGKTHQNIEDWLIWFNNRWMSKEAFQSNLAGVVYGNRALYHIFIDYCEKVSSTQFTTAQLKNLMGKSPSIEHILSQTPTFVPTALGFNNQEDFIDYEHRIGNLTILEKSLNSSVQNKSAIDKVDSYFKSDFSMTRKVGSEIDSKKTFTKVELQKRTKELVDYCIGRWWSDQTTAEPESKNIQEEENKDGQVQTLVWNGYCPESFLKGKTVRMKLNESDFYESEETGLQICVLPGVQAILLNFRGNGKFRSAPNYADEFVNGEILSPQNIDKAPFNDGAVFQSNEDLVNFLKGIK